METLHTETHTAAVPCGWCGELVCADCGTDGHGTAPGECAAPEHGTLGRA